MQRDFGDELLIAVVAIGVIAFAVVFGILLSLVGAPASTAATSVPLTVVASEDTLTPAGVVPTAMTAVIVFSETPLENATSSLTNIPTASVPSTATQESTSFLATVETPTVQPTDAQSATGTSTTAPATEQSSSVETIAPQDTATDTPVDTAEPAATHTSEPTFTRTPEPSATDTPDPTATDTPEPAPTATDTTEPTATDTVGPTSTVTETPEPTATDTSTPTTTLTNTPDPTATSTGTPSSTPTDTATATNTETPTTTDTPTPTPTATFTASPTAIPTGTRDEQGLCLYPPAYGRYMAMPGDTIEALAEAADLSPDALRGANCFAEDAVIITGDVIYVPQEVEATPTPDGTDVPWMNIGCENPMKARISTPIQGALISGASPIIGTAFATPFVGYRLELRRDEAVEYELLRALQVPALQSVLGTLDLTGREPGLYWLRLVVTADEDEIADGAVCVVPVFVVDAD